MTENTVANLEHRFQKGQSGNPAGKPKGARHKTTLLAERLMQDDVEKIVNAVLTAARNGDMMAAKIILDRIAPVSRRQCVSFDLPKIESLHVFCVCVMFCFLPMARPAATASAGRARLGVRSWGASSASL